MEILYLLIPIAVVLLAGAIWLFLWAIRSGQYEDMEGPAHRILMDDHDPMIPDQDSLRPGARLRQQSREKGQEPGSRSD